MTYPRLAALALLAASLVPAAARAQRPLADFQTWVQAQATVDLDRATEGLALVAESTVRRGSPTLVNDAGERNDASVTYLFVRPSLSYEALPHLRLSLGYGYAPIFYDDPAVASARDVCEHRVFEQLRYDHDAGALSLGTRTRLEERMRTRGPGDGDTAVRLRQRVRLSIAVPAEPRVALVLSDELHVFLNTTDFESVPGFSENRAFAGVGCRGESGVAFEVGYLHQYVGGPVSTHRSNHVLRTSAKVTLGS